MEQGHLWKLPKRQENSLGYTSIATTDFLDQTTNYESYSRAW
jgi:hypothetical protein